MYNTAVKLSSGSSCISNSIISWIPLHEKTTLLIYLIMIILIFTAIMVAIVNKGYQFIYNKINKPPISPSAEIAMGGWAIILFFLGFSTYRARVCANKLENTKLFMNAAIVDTLFILLLSLFILWLISFYGAGAFNTALILSIIQLIFSIIALGLFYQISKIAGISMLPIVIWLCYIVYINFQVVRLNP